MAEYFTRSAQTVPRRHERGSVGLWDRPALLDMLSGVLLWGAAAIFAWAFMSWFSTKPFFPLREAVVLTPSGRVTAEQIEYATRSVIRGNFFTVNLDNVREALEQLPWVRRAEVRRRWPDALELRLEEQQAVAYWAPAGNDEIQLVNRQGEVFTAASSMELPSFSGPVGLSGHLFARHREFSDVIKPLGREVVRLDLSARRAWELELDDGLVILLGRENERAPVRERLERFVQNWPETSSRVGVPVAIVDVRYQRGFALTPAQLPQNEKRTTQ